MKPRQGKYVFLILVFLFSFCLNQNAAAKQNKADKFIPLPPRFELTLDLNELNVLTGSISDGLNKYGGELDFEITASKIKQGSLWKLTIKNPKIPDVLKLWLSEKSLGIIKTINPDKLNPNDKLTLKVIKSLADKIDASKNNPVWDEIKVSGKIVREKDNLFIKGPDFQYLVTGQYTNAIKAMKDKDVVMHGFVKIKDQIEASRVILKKNNTLELFLMSRCPFGKKAEVGLIHFINALPEDKRPKLEIRYIFYFKDNKFTSLHGEPELVENLVQMVIRDNFNPYFFPYLLERDRDMEIPWRDLAAEIGLSDNDIKTIETKITKERQKRIQSEYDYAVRAYGITDGSPTYVWESEIIPDIRKVEVFKDLDFSTKEKCND